MLSRTGRMQSLPRLMTSKAMIKWTSGSARFAFEVSIEPRHLSELRALRRLNPPGSWLDASGAVAFRMPGVVRLHVLPGSGGIPVVAQEGQDQGPSDVRIGHIGNTTILDGGVSDVFMFLVGLASCYEQFIDGRGNSWILPTSADGLGIVIRRLDREVAAEVQGAGIAISVPAHAFVTACKAALEQSADMLEACIPGVLAWETMRQLLQFAAPDAGMRGNYGWDLQKMTTDAGELPSAHLRDSLRRVLLSGDGHPVVRVRWQFDERQFDRAESIARSNPPGSAFDTLQLFRRLWEGRVDLELVRPVAARRTLPADPSFLDAVPEKGQRYRTTGADVIPLAELAVRLALLVLERDSSGHESSFLKRPPFRQRSAASQFRIPQSFLNFFSPGSGNGRAYAAGVAFLYEFLDALYAFSPRAAQWDAFLPLRLAVVRSRWSLPGETAKPGPAT